MKLTRRHLGKIIQKTISESAIPQNQYIEKDVINFLKILRMVTLNPDWDVIEKSINQATSMLSSIFNIECDFDLTGGPDYYGGGPTIYNVWFYCDDTRLLDLIDSTSKIKYDINEYGRISYKEGGEPLSRISKSISCKESWTYHFKALYSPPKK